MDETAEEMASRMASAFQPEAFAPMRRAALVTTGVLAELIAQVRALYGVSDGSPVLSQERPRAAIRPRSDPAAAGRSDTPEPLPPQRSA